MMSKRSHASPLRSNTRVGAVCFDPQLKLAQERLTNRIAEIRWAREANPRGSISQGSESVDLRQIQVIKGGSLGSVGNNLSTFVKTCVSKDEAQKTADIFHYYTSQVGNPLSQVGNPVVAYAQQNKVLTMPFLLGLEQIEVPLPDETDDASKQLRENIQNAHTFDDLKKIEVPLPDETDYASKQLLEQIQKAQLEFFRDTGYVQLDILNNTFKLGDEILFQDCGRICQCEYLPELSILIAIASLREDLRDAKWDILQKEEANLPRKCEAGHLFNLCDPESIDIVFDEELEECRPRRRQRGIPLNLDSSDEDESNEDESNDGTNVSTRLFA